MIDETNLLEGLRTGDWLDRQTFPALSWIVEGLVPEGLTLLIGGPKIGKSWLSLDVGLAVAVGGRAVGCIPVKQRNVLLLALEDSDRRLQDRARQLLGRDPIPERLHYMTRVQPGAVVPTIMAWLDNQPQVGLAPLVFLDTLGKVMPPKGVGENDYMRDYRVAGQLKAVADSWPGMALVALHHDRKAQAEDFVDSVSGTNGIAGAADTILVLSRRRNEETGRFLVTGRDVTEADYAVTITGCRWRLEGNSLAAASKAAVETRATHNLGDDSARIVRFAAQHPDGVRAADVVAELGLSNDSAKRYLARLADAGRLRKESRGLYLPILSTVPSVPSVPFGDDDTEEGDTRDTRDTRCKACGFPMADLSDGATTHPGCTE